jgi:hypothetical protein
MAKVEWNDAVKTVSGALVKINKKSQHAADQKMVLATHRTAATTNPECNNIYLRKPTKRSTPLTPNEIEVRDKFTAVAKAVN